jgi:alpha-L-fucosidase
MMLLTPDAFRKPLARFLQSTAILLIAFATFCCGVSAQSAAPTAPTNSLDPFVIDQIWQDASAKYDERRTTILEQIKQIDQEGPFHPEWESLQKYQVPDWYRDAKFGIFIHWGVYSVPAFDSEWYPREMYRQGSPAFKHHLAVYGSQEKFGYKDFVPMFKAERFDPVAWARLFKEAGAKYVVPVAEHHDGFAMYDSGLTDWSAVKMGPHRDVIGDLANAVRAEGLHFGVSSHRVEHNFFFDGGRQIASDVNDPHYAAFYGPAHAWLANKRGTPVSNDFSFVSQAWTSDWLARSAEIVDKYHPDIMYFDWWIGQPSVRPDLARFAAFYYNSSLKWSGHAGVINYKDFALQENSAVLDLERGQLDEIRTVPWQTDTSVSNKSWGFIENDTFKSPQFIVHQLVDIVSKNGNLLLNIGPRSDGTIPDEVQKVLRSVGSWLAMNGDAIYGTRPWHVYGEGPTKIAAGSFHDTETAPFTPDDFRFTTRGGVLYAIELGWPSSEEATIQSLGSVAMPNQTIVSVVLLGSGATLKFEQKSDALHIHLPARAPCDFAYSFAITLSSAPKAAEFSPTGLN